MLARRGARGRRELTPIASPGEPFGCVLAIGPEGPDEADFREIAALVDREGAVLLRGLPPGAETLARVSERLARSFVPYPGMRREAVGDDDTIRTVEIGLGAIPLHAELSYLPAPPDRAFFACERAPARGGQTTLCDGIALARALPEDARRLFETRSLRWEAVVPAHVWQAYFRCETVDALHARVGAAAASAFTLRAGGALHVRHRMPGLSRHRLTGAPMFVNNLLHNHGRYTNLAFDDGSGLTDAMHAAILAEAEAITCEIAWEPGDLVILDNARVLHGRRAIEDDRRRILARFGTA